MKLRGLLTSAMAAQVVVTAVALLVSYAVSGPDFGVAQVVALIASSAVAVLLARLCAGHVATLQDEHIAARLAEQAQARADSAQVTQVVIKTALDAFMQTDERRIVLEWSPQAEALTCWSRPEAIGAD